jgi:hypothetical protein
MSEEAARTETDLGRAEREYQAARDAVMRHRSDVVRNVLRADRTGEVFAGPNADDLECLLDDLSSRATLLYMEIARDELLTTLDERDAEREREDEDKW